MKLVKKLIAGIAAVAMSTTFLAAMSVSADTKPTMTNTVTVDGSVATLKISYKDGPTVNNAIGLKINIDDTIFDMSAVGSAATSLFQLSSAGTITTDLDMAGQFYSTLNFVNGKLTLIGSNQAYTFAQKYDNLLTIKLPIKDSTSLNKNGYTFTFDKASCSLGAVQGADEIVYEEAKIEAEAAGKAVTVAPTTNGTVTASATTDVAEGTEVTLTVTPDEGYELDTISAATATGTVEIVDNKFTMPAEDVTVTATFKKIKVVAGIEATDVKEGTDGFSMGFSAEFENIPEADVTNVIWTLTKNGKSQPNTLDYNTAGVKGNVKFGLIVTLDENLFEGVSAAAELE